MRFCDFVAVVQDCSKT